MLVDSILNFLNVFNTNSFLYCWERNHPCLRLVIDLWGWHPTSLPFSYSKPLLQL